MDFYKNFFIDINYLKKENFQSNFILNKLKIDEINSLLEDILNLSNIQLFSESIKKIYKFLQKKGFIEYLSPIIDSNLIRICLKEIENHFNNKDTSYAIEILFYLSIPEEFCNNIINYDFLIIFEEYIKLLYVPKIDIVILTLTNLFLSNSIYFQNFHYNLLFNCLNEHRSNLSIIESIFLFFSKFTNFYYY